MNYEKSEKYEVLKRYFGYDSFREGQEILIDGILDGRDVLGIMPTGSGKSLCYQVPALILPGNHAGGVTADFSDEGSSHGTQSGGRPRGVSEQFADDGTVL